MWILVAQELRRRLTEVDLCRTFANADDFVQNYGSENKCRWGFAVDFAEQVSSFVHPGELVSSSKGRTSSADIRQSSSTSLMRNGGWQNVD